MSNIVLEAKKISKSFTDGKTTVEVIKNLSLQVKAGEFVSIVGSSGSGKSVTAVIPMISFIANAKVKRSIFVTDPKGEIYHTTSKMLHDKGYKVLTIDFRHPELSNHINTCKTS